MCSLGQPVCCFKIGQLLVLQVLVVVLLSLLFFLSPPWSSQTSSLQGVFSLKIEQLLRMMSDEEKPPAPPLRNTSNQGHNKVRWQFSKFSEFSEKTQPQSSSSGVALPGAQAHTKPQ